MKFGLKWVHMARYELILRLDGAPWLRIISKPLLTQKCHIKIQKLSQKGGSRHGEALFQMCAWGSLAIYILH